MVDVYHTEKKVPLTVLETKIGDKIYQFTVEATSSIVDCMSALDAFKAHVDDIAKKAEEAQQEKLQDETQPTEPVEV